MPTFNYLVRTEKDPAFIYIRFSEGRGRDIMIKSRLKVDPRKWSNKKHTLKQYLETDRDDRKLLNDLKGLEAYVWDQYRKLTSTASKEWLSDVAEQYFNPKSGEAKTLNEFIAGFINEGKEGKQTNKDGMNFTIGTLRSYEGFQSALNRYQGIYSEKDLKKLTEDKKKPRPLKKVDFEDIDLAFYESFKSYLASEGYKPNTIGRFIKILKYFMQKSLDKKLHDSRDFQNKSVFKGINLDSFSIYLTGEEIELIYKRDLSKFPRMELARDAFIVLCETALRVSDYPKISVNVRKKNGGKLIYITQTKTGDEVVIPCSRRMGEILEKYRGNLPFIPDVYINKYIKTIAHWCGIDETLTWEVSKYGKRYSQTAPKWKLITCHTGRRSGATNMYLAGIPVLDIMKITGHRTQVSFMKYIKIGKEETAIRLMDHPYFSGLKVAN